MQSNVKNIQIEHKNFCFTLCYIKIDYIHLQNAYEAVHYRVYEITKFVRLVLL